VLCACRYACSIWGVLRSCDRPHLVQDKHVRYTSSTLCCKRAGHVSSCANSTQSTLIWFPSAGHISHRPGSPLRCARTFTGFCYYPRCLLLCC
jgi:hypothetical protein